VVLVLDSILKTKRSVLRCRTLADWLNFLIRFGISLLVIVILFISTNKMTQHLKALKTKNKRWTEEN
jgi:hypothetical protein